MTSSHRSGRWTSIYICRAPPHAPFSHTDRLYQMLLVDCRMRRVCMALMATSMYGMRQLSGLACQRRYHAARLPITKHALAARLPSVMQTCSLPGRACGQELCRSCSILAWVSEQHPCFQTTSMMSWGRPRMSP